MNKKRLTLAFFLSLFLFIVIMFYVFPLILTVYIGFTPMKNWNIARYFLQVVGLENYKRLVYIILHDPDMKGVVITTVVFVFFTLMINVFGGLLLALATFFMEEKVSATYQVLWLLPRMTPVAVYSLLWYYFFHPTSIGILNAILKGLNIITEPIGIGIDPKYMPWGAWSVIIFVNGLVGVSYGMIIFYSAFKSIPRELIIASRVDGASTFQIITKILIPLTRWHLTFVIVWQLLSLLTSYAHIFLLLEWRIVSTSWGQPWALYVFRTAFSTIKDQGLAATAAVILSIIGITLGILSLKALGYEKMMTEPRGDV